MQIISYHLKLNRIFSREVHQRFVQVQSSENFVHNYLETLVTKLVIKDFYRNPETFYRDPETYYKDHVIRGSGAFLELAHTFDDFERAMKRKLLREIVPGAVGMLDSRPRSTVGKLQ